MVGTKKLSVLALLFDITRDDNEFLDNAGFNLPPEDDYHKINNLPRVLKLDDFISRFLAGGYYNYHGSLTTPPCYETVNWFVLKKRSGISKKQLDLFKGILKEHVNSRGLQQLNGRIVRDSWQHIENENLSVEVEV